MPLPVLSNESAPIDTKKPAIRCEEKSRRSKCCHPEEMPVIPEQAMEFLSRTWSPSSSDLFQILSPSSLGPSLENHDPEGPRGDGDGDEDQEQQHVDAVRVGGGRSQLFNQTCRVLASGKPSSGQRRHKLTQPTWLNVGNMKAVLRGFLLDSVPVTGSRRRRRRDELRLHSAQAHAAVSVAQLAAAVAGIVSVCELRSAAANAGDKGIGTALVSAAALVATVCAEAAETAGANRGRVTSAARTGLECRSSAELLTLTATAATCLRGAAALKLRAADLKGIGRGGNAMATSISVGIQKGTTLRVCLPCGRVRVRTVAVFPQRGGGAVALRLGKKRLHGAFATYEDYEVSAVGDGGGGGGEAVVEGRPAFPVAVSTTEGATVQLLFEHQTHCKIWKAAIEGMLSDQMLKRANN
ncbi:VAN3-binding protein-like isoform X2 [Phragmites australis]|uniref:VAN3-binding protein-like isoform X2 n=1 Tax=Phragmites australis TaxID=29695 RepID=UPI002D791B3E|nr:VAN3-binding protein-like isoform X2 [Phragmites australis]